MHKCVCIPVYFIYIFSKHILTSPHLFSFFTGAKHSDSIFYTLQNDHHSFDFEASSWPSSSFFFFFFFLIFLIYLAVLGLSCGMWDLVLLKMKVKSLSHV